jgi:hypothetical protein
MGGIKMNHSEARQLAENVTTEQLQQMLVNAKASIKNWNVRSRVNKGLSKGAAFNILSAPAIFVAGKRLHILAATNMIWEFGEYLPGYQNPEKKEKEYGTF